MTTSNNPSAWAANAPQTFEDLAFADNYTRQDLYDYVQYPQLCGNIILEGGYGSGKSTIAAIIAKERLGNTASVYELNGEAWDDDTLSTLRGTFNLARVSEQVAVIIINEVDRLKEKQYKFREFLDENAQRLLVIMTTNLLSNIDGSIVDRSDVFRVRGFEPQQAVAVAQNVLVKYSVKFTDSDLLPIFQRSLVGDETELSLRKIGRIVDKLVLLHAPPPKASSNKAKLTVV
jgi:replication-associated recombination protein RarA